MIDFNPRSREGSDRCNREIDRFKKNFNPRSREGSDLSFKNFLNSAIYFNPRSREGSDGTTFATFAAFRLFQSTLPRRERRRFLHKPHLIRRFQSTLPRRERRYTARHTHSWVLISIHAPAKGATESWERACAPLRNFNPRSREGSDQREIMNAFVRIISIHAPAKGATVDLVYNLADCVFQSTLPRRERQHLLTSFRLQYGYSLFHLTNKI